MSKDAKTVNEMVDYVRQLRRHTEGRRAIHIRVSSLEKHFREEHYRRFVAVAMRPLITNFGATMYALPNYDVVLMVKDASVDTIDPLLQNIRHKYKESALIAGLDVVQGVSDAFVEWFDLEADYQGFLKYVQEFAEKLLDKNSNAKSAPSPAPIQSSGNVAVATRPKAALKTSKHTKLVAVEKKEKKKEDVRQLDIDLLHSLTASLQNADISNMRRTQKIMAVLGTQASIPVMVHWSIPCDVVFDSLLMAKIEMSDAWLKGNLEDFLAGRLLTSKPDLQNTESIATSLRASCRTVLSDAFDQFNDNLGDQQRSAIVIQLRVQDIMANLTQYQNAQKKIEELGFKMSVSGLDLRVLPWLDFSNLDADFIKLTAPDLPEADWLTVELEWAIKDQVKKIGLARLILEGCEQKENVELAQRLGITLFQGAAVAPISKD